MTFDELETISEPTIGEIRGFIYKSKDGQWIIDERPNLKSCCIGAEENVKRQVFLDDEIAGLDHNIMVHFKGTLTISPEYLDGQMISYYHIRHAELIDNPFAWGSLAIVVGVVTFIALIFKQSNAKSLEL